MPDMRQIALASTLVLVALLLPAAPSSAEEIEYDRQWPEWRGPLKSGVAPFGNPPRTWSETQNIRWKKKIPGVEPFLHLDALQTHYPHQRSRFCN